MAGVEAHVLLAADRRDAHYGAGCVTDPNSDVDAVIAFNDAIDARDLDALTALMTDDHRFVDSEGATIDGVAACTDAWRGFFAAFPDYRNVFDHVRNSLPGVVDLIGRSECSVAELDGPARWQAEVRDGKVALWQVSAAPGEVRCSTASTRLSNASHVQPAVQPPSTARTEPTQKLAASDAKKRIASAISSGWARRPIGIICA